jgi:hypothetical protein
MDTNHSEHGPERKNGKRDNLLENEMVWFHFIDKVFADGPNSFSLLRCRLLNTCDEEVADNDIFVWVAWDTAPGGEFCSFDVNKNRLPVDYSSRASGTFALTMSPLCSRVSTMVEINQQLESE